MERIDLILIVAAFVCEALAAVSVSSGRVNLIALGLAFWFLTMLTPLY